MNINKRHSKLKSWSNKKSNTSYTYPVLLLTSFLFFVSVLFAQSPSCFTVLSSTPQKLILRFKAETVQLKKADTLAGAGFVIETSHGTPGLKKGMPALSHYTVSVQVPAGSHMVVRVLSSHFRKINGIRITPSAGKIYRNVRYNRLLLVDDTVYHCDCFYPETLCKTGPSYFLRNRHGQTLSLTPFQYNPVQKILRVYNEIILEVTFRQTDKQYAAAQHVKYVAVWQELLRHHFINGTPAEKRSKPEVRFPEMLVISYGPFIPLLKDFVEWKQKCGLMVRLVDADTLKTAAAVKSCIQNIYRKSNLTYVLLVGDANQVPPDSIAGNTADNGYAYLSGNDHYPDIFIGRMPAATAEQLMIMLQRTMAYEKGILADTGFYARPTGIASEMGPGYHHLYDYQHIRFIDSILVNRGKYHQAVELFDGSHGAPDADGNPTRQMLTSVVNQGTGLINYCGHGSALGWNTTGFGTAQVKRLSNTGSWPLIISVSCATGAFVHQECFAESWLRASYNGFPTGAVAALMPTIDQSWKPPMSGQQAMNKLIASAGKAGYPQTFGAICMAGCMKMNDDFGVDGYEITDTWELFGDPALVIRTAAPRKIEVNYPAVVADSCTRIYLSTLLQNGTATLVSQGNLYAAASIDSSGRCVLQLDSIPESREADLTVTAFNHKAFFGHISWELSAAADHHRQQKLQVKVFPNPVIEKATISVSPVRNCMLSITVFDAKGKITASWVTGRLSPGEHHFCWKPLTSGIYFLRVTGDNQTIRRKIIVVKDGSTAGF